MAPSAANKVALVTGASSGIGAALAVEAAREGYCRLALTARRTDRLEEVARRVRELGGEPLVVPADLADPGAPERIIAAVLDRFGGLDVLVNNAGLGLFEPYSTAPPGDVRRQVEVNLVAPLVLTRLALPHLLERQGTVINIGSAITYFPNPGLGAYGATKAGLAYWNDALRRELRHRGLRVCLVEPGPVATEFFDAAPGRGPGGYDPFFDRPPAFLHADAARFARRVVRLIEHPRRRLSAPRRTVWPYRLAGALARLAPGLGDALITSMIRHNECRAARPANAETRRSPDDVPSPR
jgi:short-subunit dehydrogenase